MKQKAITQRVKFLIKHIIGIGVASNQEELGKKIGINNKSYFSQLISGQRSNEKLINLLLNYAPDINKEWLYNEGIESPFLDGEVSIETKEDVDYEEVIKGLETNIIMLHKDVKYYSDIADSRLQTINIQNKLIDALEQQLKK